MNPLVPTGTINLKTKKKNGGLWIAHKNYMDIEEKEVDKWKTIVVLSSDSSTGKTIFDYVIKNERYYVWNINLYEISEEYSDFIPLYIRNIIERFVQRDEPNVLVFHGCNIEASRKIVDEHPNAFTINIRKIGSEVSIEHDITLFIDESDAEDFKKEVLKTINILTKNL